MVFYGLSWTMFCKYLNLGRDCFLPHLSQFILPCDTNNLSSLHHLEINIFFFILTMTNVQEEQLQCETLRLFILLFIFFIAIQCDEKCSHYSPCVQTCPKQTCDNYIIHKKFNQLCSEDACVEGVLKVCFNLLSISVFSRDNIRLLIDFMLISFHVKSM